MKTLIAITLLLFSYYACSSIPVQVTLVEMVEKSDHMLLGKVVSVEMRDKDNSVVDNPKAMTGPGLENTIFLIIEVSEVYFTNVDEFPEILRVPLDSFMHYSLGQIKEAHKDNAEPYLMLLSGQNFTPPFPGRFFVDLESRVEIMEMRKSNN